MASLQSLHIIALVTTLVSTCAESPYTSLGCIVDDEESRALESIPGLSPFKSSVMTVDFCSGHCDGYRFFGIQFGNECWCGNSMDFDAYPLVCNSLADCNVDCPGDNSQKCGAFYRMNVFKHDGDSIDVDECRSNCPGGSNVVCGLNGVSHENLCYASCDDSFVYLHDGPCENQSVQANRLNTCQSLSRGDKLVSQNGAWIAELQDDGNFVLKTNDGAIEWQSDNSDAGIQLIIQTDGHLVMYSCYNCTDAVWSTGVYNYPSKRTAYLMLHDNGKLSVHGGLGVLRWTAGHDPSIESPYTSLGCIYDDDARALDLIEGVSPIQSTIMTVDYCSGHCDGYRFFGVQFGNECWCGNNLDFDAYPLVCNSFTDCHLACPGDNSQKCGASFRLNVFKHDGDIIDVDECRSNCSGDSNAVCGLNGLSHENLCYASCDDSFVFLHDGPCENQSVQANRLNACQSLFRGDKLVSQNGAWIAELQDDGNLVLRTNYGAVVWQADKSAAGIQLIIQTDGHLVLYSYTAAVWSTGVYGYPNTRTAYLMLHDNGELRVHDGLGAVKWTAGHDPNIESAYLSLGCIYDDEESRALDTIEESSIMTVDYCSGHCDGYRFFGLQYGIQCWCGNSVDFDTYPLVCNSFTECNLDCPGDNSQKCGGFFRMNVFKYHGDTIDVDECISNCSDDSNVVCGLNGLSYENLCYASCDDGFVYLHDGPCENQSVQANRLNTCQSLIRGDRLVSQNGAWIAELQNDGDFVLRTDYGAIVWQADKSVAGIQLIMQTDGHLVMYNHLNDVWATGVYNYLNKRTAYLMLHDNGELSVHDGLGAVKWTANYDPVTREDNFVLLSRHRDTSVGFFSESVIDTGLENEEDPSANTYCIIGAVDPAMFQLQELDGWYELELIYEYVSDPVDVLRWSQDSWIGETRTVVDANLTAISDVYSSDACLGFHGLAKSSSDQTYLDGSTSESCWWHSVALVHAFLDGIPAHEKRVAARSELWIRKAPILAPVPTPDAAPYMTRDDNFVLLSRHRSAFAGFFSEGVIDTGVENEEDPTANTYSIIGAVDSAMFQLQEIDGWYELELIYEYVSDPVDILRWSQDSWIDETRTVVDVNLTAISDAYSSDACLGFHGLAKSSSDQAYLDGSTDQSCWWHSVALVHAFLDGIPAHEGRVAAHSELWIRKEVTIATDAPTNEPSSPPTEAPTMVPTETPTLEPSSPPTMMPTEAPTMMPTEIPTVEPSSPPTEEPTMIPTEVPTTLPTETPTVEPTATPETSLESALSTSSSRLLPGEIAAILLGVLLLASICGMVAFRIVTRHRRERSSMTLASKRRGDALKPQLDQMKGAGQHQDLELEGLPLQLSDDADPEMETALDDNSYRGSSTQSSRSRSVRPRNTADLVLGDVNASDRAERRDGNDVVTAGRRDVNNASESAGHGHRDVSTGESTGRRDVNVVLGEEPLMSISLPRADDRARFDAFLVNPEDLDDADYDTALSKPSHSYSQNLDFEFDPVTRSPPASGYDDSSSSNELGASRVDLQSNGNTYGESRDSPLAHTGNGAAEMRHIPVESTHGANPSQAEPRPESHNEPEPGTPANLRPVINNEPESGSQADRHEVIASALGLAAGEYFASEADLLRALRGFVQNEGDSR